MLHDRLEFLSPARFVCFLLWSCCWSSIALEAPTAYRECLRFASLPQTARNNEVLFVLNSTYRRDEDQSGQLLILGYPVCEDCWTGLYDVSESTFRRLKGSVRDGVVSFQHKNVGTSHGPTTAGLECRVWMAQHFELVGDFQPGMLSHV